MSEPIVTEVAGLAQKALGSSPIYELRSLRVQPDGDCLFISGVVTSYYHKQLAQEVVRTVIGRLGVVNSIRVESPDARDASR
jgi:hypothetical protein